MTNNYTSYLASGFISYGCFKCVKLSSHEERGGGRPFGGLYYNEIETNWVTNMGHSYSSAAGFSVCVCEGARPFQSVSILRGKPLYLFSGSTADEAYELRVRGRKLQRSAIEDKL